MEAQLNQAFQLVSQPNTQAIKEGENLLQHLKKDSQYPLALLHYISQSNTPEVGKLRAAIELKLWCQHYKDLEEFQRQYYAQSLEDVKQNILMAYLTFPLKISKTLRSGLVILAHLLFPKQWPNLMISLLAYVSQAPGSTMAVLKLIQSITYKYSYEGRSDPLYEEIIQVCNQLHDFLLNLTLNVLQRVQQNPESTDDVVMLEVLMKIFYNLNYQDLHPKFEDHIQPWMGIIKTVMGLHNSSENIFKCKGATLEAILLYASKYKEDVQGIIQGFCSEIWQLCSGASEDPEYDSIVFNCLKFFKSLLLWQEMQPFFRQHMSELFENLIIPNIGINKAHIALFEEEIELYIDYYFRNTEIQTRRAAALELLRVVCRHYKLIEGFIEQQLQNFQGVADNVQAECTLLTLIIDGSNKGFRDIDGCTQLFVRQQLIHYTYNSIVKKTLFNMYEWLGKNPEHKIESQFNPIHIATIIRFLFYFRIYFPKEELSSILQFLTTIKSENKSLLKVIYLSINGFLVMRHGDFLHFRNLTYYFRGEVLKSSAVNILKVAYEGTMREEALQESLTKMLYNVTRGLANLNQQFFDYQIQIIKEMLKRTKVYDFTSVQYLFEAIGELAFRLITCNSAKKHDLEKEVMSYFMEALKNKTDLLNFCLQILSIFLHHQQGTNPQHKAIYESLLMGENWREQNQSLMSSYIQFLIAFIAGHKERLIEDKVAIQNILSQIIKIDHIELFYRFMEAIMIHTTLQEFYQSGYLSLVVQAGQATGQSITGRKASLLFICKMIVNYDTAAALRLLNQCCGNYFDQLLQASTDILKTLSQRFDRKTLFAAVCKAIQCNYFQNAGLLGEIMNCLIVNTVERFNFRNISQQIIESETKEKKESTYKKLMVFKEFEKQPRELEINEEEEILNTFKYVSNAFPDIINYIEQRNRERLLRLNEKYQK